MTKSNNKNNEIVKEENELLQYFTEEELQMTAKELDYMEEHLEEYKSYDNINDLKEDLLNDD